MKFSNHYTLKVIRDGKVVHTARTPNLVTAEGLQDFFNVYCRGDSPPNTFYMGLMAGPQVPNNVYDTMASHDFTESVKYSGDRKVWNDGLIDDSPSISSIANEVDNPSVFKITGPFELSGIFLTSSETKGGTTGLLFSEALTSIELKSNDTVEITYELRVATDDSQFGNEMSREFTTDLLETYFKGDAAPVIYWGWIRFQLTTFDISVTDTLLSHPDWNEAGIQSETNREIVTFPNPAVTVPLYDNLGTLESTKAQVKIVGQVDVDPFEFIPSAGTALADGFFLTTEQTYAGTAGLFLGGRSFRNDIFGANSLRGILKSIPGETLTVTFEINAEEGF